MLNVPIANIFDTLSINLGTSYVNDFNAFGRIYQVRAQADQQFRMERQDIDRLKVRSATDELVPLGTLVEIKDVSGPNLVQRYNMFVSVPEIGRAHVWTPVTNAHLVCRLLLDKTKTKSTQTNK